MKKIAIIEDETAIRENYIEMLNYRVGQTMHVT